jgi:hypothetical protein
LEEALARETQGYEEMKSAVKKREAEAGQTLPGKGNKNNGSDAPPVDDDSDAETVRMHPPPYVTFQTYAFGFPSAATAFFERCRLGKMASLTLCSRFFFVGFQ